MIASKASYRHEDYFFQREQSRGSKQLEWESRASPLKGWSSYTALAMGAILLLLLAVRVW